MVFFGTRRRGKALLEVVPGAAVIHFKQPPDDRTRGKMRPFLRQVIMNRPPPIPDSPGSEVPRDMLEEAIAIRKAARDTRIVQLCLQVESLLRADAKEVHIEGDGKKTEIGDEGVKILVAAMKDAGRTVREVSLSRCGVHDEGAKILAGALASCPNLESLSLRANRIGDEGAKALAEAVGKFCPALRYCSSPLPDYFPR